MSDPNAKEPAQPQDTVEREYRGIARRAPKYWVFGVIGALGALIFTATIATLTPASDGLSKGQAFGFVLFWAVPIGVAVLLALALLIDWLQRRKAKQVTLIQTKISTDDEPEGSAPHPESQEQQS